MILPQFPLQLVVFPREVLNLHIFEDRYKALINETQQKDGTFGIVPYINGRVASHGTEVRIKQIHSTYEDGRIDLACEGLQVYRINQFIPVPPEQGYSSADVTYVHSSETSEHLTKKAVFDLLQELTNKLSSPLTFDITVEELHTSKIIHKLGLPIEQELDILKLLDEESRLEALKSHLKDFIPHLDRADEIRRRIKLNGHFKRLDPLDF